LAGFRPGGETLAPIIGATCGFDARIYKIVGGIFAVSACGEGNKKNFKNSVFCLALPPLLVEMMPSHSRRLPGNILPFYARLISGSDVISLPFC